MRSFIGRLLAGEIAEEPVLSPARFAGAVLPAADPAAELAVDDSSGAVPENRALILLYEDSSGITTRRRIALLEVYEAAGFVYLKARCLERRALRTFRADRVLEVYSGVTGEDLGDPCAVFVPTSVRGAPSVRRSRQPEGSEASRFRAVRAGLRVLMTIARADGYVHEGEAAEVGDFVTACLGYGAHGSDELVAEALELAPSFSTFLECCETVFELDHEVARQVLSTAMPLARADGRVDDVEAAVIADLADFARSYGLPVIG